MPGPRLFLSLLFACVVAAAVVLPQTGCDTDEGDNATTTTTSTPGVSIGCVPCGGIDLRCDVCVLTGCPVCYDIDMQSGGMRMVYDDGSYYTVTAGEAGGPSEMVFYDSTGSQCMRMEMEQNGEATLTTFYSRDNDLCYEARTDSAAETVTYTTGSKTYVYHTGDETWDCPNGTTWSMPDYCDAADTGEVEEPDANCPQIGPCDDSQFGGI